MHPFWAVRRLTWAQLEREQRTTQMGKLRPRFNCELTEQALNVVCIAPMEGKACNRTRIFEVPFLTNTMPLEDGEGLIMEIEEKTRTATTPNKRTWRDAEKEKQRKKPKV